jgi:serine/threonine protein kinase
MNGHDYFPEQLRGRYRPECGSRSGAMGRVIKAFDRDLNRYVAIKIVEAPLRGDSVGEKIFEGFKDEARAAATLKHANIVTVHDVGHDKNLSWMVMEYVEGGTLRDFIDRRKILTLPEILSIITQLLEALTYCHKNKIIHHDIKPGNILMNSVDEFTQIKLADFGIAKIVSLVAINNEEPTLVAGPRGTPSYMSPEQYQEIRSDVRSDIWAVGIILYELLTGKKPFTGDYLTIKRKISTESLAPPSTFSVLSTKKMDAVVLKALARRPEDRFQDAASFQKALLSALEPSPGAQPRSRLKLPLAGLSALVLIGAAAFVFLPDRHSVELSLSAPPAAHPSAHSSTTSPLPLPEQPAERSVVPPSPPSRDSVQPPPQLIPGPTPGERQRVLLAQIPGMAPCSVLEASIVNDALKIAGYVSTANQIRVNEAARNVGLAIEWSTVTHDGPYCDLLSAVRPIMVTTGLPTMTARESRLRAGDVLTLDLVMAEWPGYANIWFIEHEGDAVQLVRDLPLPPSAQRRIRESNNTPWEIDGPFGIEMIVLVASERPLSYDQRLSSQPVSTLATDVAGAINSAERSGQRVSARVIFVETTERQPN